MLNLIPIKTPSIVKWMFPNYVWNIPTTDKILYLTFDDGPTPEITEWTLDILQKHNAKATFFCIGTNIEKHPSIFQRLIGEGHSIGNHTFNHPRGWKTKTEAYIEEVVHTQHTIDLQISNYNNPDDLPISKSSNRRLSIVNLFRPPYGQITLKQGKSLLKLGYKIIMWDVLAFDWTEAQSREKCFQNVISKAVPGSIIVFHDSEKAAKRMQYALPKILEHFTEKGFEFRRIPE